MTGSANVQRHCDKSWAQMVFLHNINQFYMTDYSKIQNIQIGLKDKC